MKKNILVLLLLGALSQSAYADGVSLGATRVIYPSNQNQVSLKIFNSAPKNNYLVQSWVSDKDGNKVNDFVVTPPLFVLKGNTNSILRIVYTGDKNKLPVDKEKIYFFNAKVIPSLTEEQKNITNSLLISTTTNIKLFMRPANLTDDPLEAYKNIRCSYANNQIKIDNPTPYYMNLASFTVNGKEISKGETIPPKDAVYLKSTVKPNQLSFNVINDYGVQLANKVCPLN
ncbi:fimbria/pilus periplasmic chaperone [Utexia brackfieldae]|uniref:fimbria/pilus periplasmic chaperone n=1 Tax=Utexia brackfieldae TaxID=3074108 RepID=UPI00370D1E0F